MHNNDKDFESLLQAIDNAVGNSYGSDNDGQLAQERAEAIDAYMRRNTNPAPEGRSQVISADVFDTIEWIKPSIMRIFSGDDDLCKFEPVGPEDEEQAAQESAYINHIITQRNPWYQITHDWFTDAMLTKNAYAMAWWDTSKVVETDTYEGQSEDQLAMMQQDPNVEIVGISQSQSETGEPAFDVQLRQKAKGRIEICVLPPERCIVSHATPSFRLKDCPYFEYWENKTISDIRSMGFDVDDDVGDEFNSDTVEDQARDQFGEMSDGTAEEIEPSMRTVQFRMIWIKHDYNGDGIAELLYVIRVGREILFSQECSRIPVACIVPTPLPHRHPGLSTADIVIEIQSIKTAILRQGIDNLFLTNNQRTAVSDKVNLDDLLQNVPGGVIRVKSGMLPGNEIMPIVTPFIFPQAMEGMEYMDQVLENRTGTNRYFTGSDQNALNKTASGISQLTSSAAQRVEQLARTFASGVEDLFSIVHELSLKHARKADVFRLRGKWITVDPSQWKTRTDIRIAIGTGAGNKDALMAQLDRIVERQGQVMPLGVSDAPKIYNALSEMTKLAGFANPDKFWTDPSVKPPPAQEPNPEIVLKQQELQQDGHKTVVDATLKQQDMQAKTQLEHEKLAAQIQLEREKMALEREKMNHEREMEAMRMAMQAQASMNDQQFRHRDMELKEKQHKRDAGEGPDEDVLTQLVSEMMASIQQMQQHLMMPKPPVEFERDASGQVMSVGGRRVLRDANGMIQSIQ